MVGAAVVGAAVVGGPEMSSLSQHPGYEEEQLRRAAEQLPCREAQAGTLLSLLGQVTGSCLHCGSSGVHQIV